MKEKLQMNKRGNNLKTISLLLLLFAIKLAKNYFTLALLLFLLLLNNIHVHTCKPRKLLLPK